MGDAQTTGGGVGFTGLLTLLFIGLKLGHVITWSWLWVLAPLWGGVAFVLLAMAGLAVFSLGDALKELRTMHTRPFHPYRTAYRLVLAAMFVAGFFYVGDLL